MKAFKTCPLCGSEISKNIKTSIYGKYMSFLSCENDDFCQDIDQETNDIIFLTFGIDSYLVDINLDYTYFTYCKPFKVKIWGTQHESKPIKGEALFESNILFETNNFSWEPDFSNMNALKNRIENFILLK